MSRDDIDAVYVSNLHMMHRDAALMAMRHGKAVLCEKPMAINAASARAMAKAAGEKHGIKVIVHMLSHEEAAEQP